MDRSSLNVARNESIANVPEQIWSLRDYKSLHTFYDDDKYNLGILMQRPKTSVRKKIPANVFEKLSYLLSHITTTMKTQTFNVSQVDYRIFFWSFILHAFCKGLPTAYIHIFLGQYAPDHHLFVSKMSPLFQVTNFILIFAALTELYCIVDYCALLLDYVIIGFVYKSPWNRCENVSKIFLNLTCLELDEFTCRAQGNMTIFNNYAYEDENGEFQISQIKYLMVRNRYVIEDQTGAWIFMLYLMLIWFTSFMLTNQIFKRRIWKVLIVFQILLYVFFSLVLMNISTNQLWGRHNHKRLTQRKSFLSQIFELDFSLLTESVSAPPIMQILSARSSEELSPGSTSSIFIICLSFFYLLRAFMIQEIKLYINDIAKITLRAPNYAPLEWFYMWPIFFYNFKIGNLWSLIFYIINFMLEFISMTITFRLLTEVIVCEWNFKYFFVSCGIITLGLVTYLVINYLFIGLMYFYTCALPAIFEIIVIYIMYPFGRLIEDVKFKYGEEPSLLQKCNLLIMPIYFFTKILFLFEKFITAARNDSENTRINVLIMTAGYFIILLMIIVIGIIVTIIIHTFVRKRKCYLLFMPVSEWGPPEYIKRLLRKRFRSSEYIASRAPRALLYHMLRSAGSDHYNIDIKYDRTTLTDQSIYSFHNIGVDIDNDNDKHKDDQEKQNEQIRLRRSNSTESYKEAF